MKEGKRRLSSAEQVASGFQESDRKMRERVAGLAMTTLRGLECCVDGELIHFFEGFIAEWRDKPGNSHSNMENPALERLRTLFAPYFYLESPPNLEDFKQIVELMPAGIISDRFQPAVGEENIAWREDIARYELGQLKEGEKEGQDKAVIDFFRSFVSEWVDHPGSGQSDMANPALEKLRKLFCERGSRSGSSEEFAFQLCLCLRRIPDRITAR